MLSFNAGWAKMDRGCHKIKWVWVIVGFSNEFLCWGLFLFPRDFVSTTLGAQVAWSKLSGFPLVTVAGFTAAIPQKDLSGQNKEGSRTIIRSVNKNRPTCLFLKLWQGWTVQKRQKGCICLVFWANGFSSLWGASNNGMGCKSEIVWIFSKHWTQSRFIEQGSEVTGDTSNTCNSRRRLCCASGCRKVCK